MSTFSDSGHTAKILVVDDSATDRVLAGSLLERAGWSVFYAEDGRDALRHIEEQPTDAVLTDLRMPHLDGLQLVGAIRRSHPRIPVILMTGVGSEEIAAKALKVGAASYVPKESLAAALVEVLRQVLAAIPHKGSSPAQNSQETHFVLDYAPKGLSNLVSRYQQHLAELGFDEAELIRIGIALTEALNNAVEHGNLGLDTSMRDDEEDAYHRLRAERICQVPYCDRRVYITQKFADAEAVFVIRDEGSGFDPNDLPDPTDPENLTKVGGRGLLLIRTFMDEVRFNASGNELTMVKRCQPAPA